MMSIVLKQQHGLNFWQSNFRISFRTTIGLPPGVVVVEKPVMWIVLSQFCYRYQILITFPYVSSTSPPSTTYTLRTQFQTVVYSSKARLKTNGHSRPWLLRIRSYSCLQCVQQCDAFASKVYKVIPIVATIFTTI